MNVTATLLLIQTIILSALLFYITRWGIHKNIKYFLSNAPIIIESYLAEKTKENDTESHMYLRAFCKKNNFDYIRSYGWIYEGDVTTAKPELLKTQRDSMGFDERELYCLDITMIITLYERLMAFTHYSGKQYTDAIITYKRKKYSDQELVNLLIKKCEEYLILAETNYPDSLDEKNRLDTVGEIYNIWKLINHTMWY